MKIPGWENWAFNRRGELYHLERPDLVFTAPQLEGLHFYHQKLAAERYDLRQRIDELEATANPPEPTAQLIVFPRYTRQRP